MHPIIEQLWLYTAQTFPGKDLDRIKGMFEVLSQERETSSAPMQQVALNEFVSVYVPGLTAKPWHDASAFPWADRLVASFPEILREMQEITKVDDHLVPYTSSYSVSGGLLGDVGTPDWKDTDWKAVYFYKSFRRVDDRCAACPKTAALLDEIGVAREALFSALEPGGHITPHSDLMNFITTCHLGLVVPDGCALSVAGETRTWEAGSCLFFDSSFEHEAWNRADQRRIVLLVDTWHPELTRAEIDVLLHLRPQIELLLGATPRSDA